MGHKTIKLFCIPFSGGNAYSYAEFKKYLPDHIELCNLELRILFVSGQTAPALIKPDERYCLPDDQFIDMLREMEGTPEELLEDKSFIQYFLPIIKTDFQSIANFKYASSSLPLNIPIAVLLGNQENVNEEDAAYWQLETEIEIAILITNKCNQLI
jgi:surfactin synthase thioesterase subunit